MTSLLQALDTHICIRQAWPQPSGSFPSLGTMAVKNEVAQPANARRNGSLPKVGLALCGFKGVRKDFPSGVLSELSPEGQVEIA